MRTIYLYRCYSESRELLYIGISIDPKRRFTHHKSSARTKHWGRFVTNIAIGEGFSNLRDAYRAEERAIRAEAPAHNIACNGRTPKCPICAAAVKETVEGRQERMKHAISLEEKRSMRAEKARKTLAQAHIHIESIGPHEVLMDGRRYTDRQLRAILALMSAELDAAMEGPPGTAPALVHRG